MQARLVWVAFAWIAALVGLAAALHGSGSTRPPRPFAASALARSPALAVDGHVRDVGAA